MNSDKLLYTVAAAHLAKLAEEKLAAGFDPYGMGGSMGGDIPPGALQQMQAQRTPSASATPGFVSHNPAPAPDPVTPQQAPQSPFATSPASHGRTWESVYGANATPESVFGTSPAASPALPTNAPQGPPPSPFFGPSSTTLTGPSAQPMSAGGLLGGTSGGGPVGPAPSPFAGAPAGGSPVAGHGIGPAEEAALAKLYPAHSPSPVNPAADSQSPFYVGQGGHMFLRDMRAGHQGTDMELNQRDTADIQAGGNRAMSQLRDYGYNPAQATQYANMGQSLGKAGSLIYALAAAHFAKEAGITPMPMQRPPLDTGNVQLNALSAADPSYAAPEYPQAEDMSNQVMYPPAAAMTPGHVEPGHGSGLAAMVSRIPPQAMTPAAGGELLGGAQPRFQNPASTPAPSMPMQRPMGIAQPR